MKKVFFLLTISLLLVNCSSKSEDLVLIPLPYSLLSENYIQDTGNESYKLTLKIKFTNPNNFGVKGSYKISVRIDGRLVTYPVLSVGTVIEKQGEHVFEIVNETPYTDGFTPPNEIVFEKAEFEVFEYPI